MRSKLLETARRLIARDGEQGLTLGSVADEAGLARATIYGYFSGKRDLLAALGAHDASAQPELDLAPPTPSTPDVADADEHDVPTWMDYQPELASFAADGADLQEQVAAVPEPVAEAPAPEVPSTVQSVATAEGVPVDEGGEHASPQDVEEPQAAPEQAVAEAVPAPEIPAIAETRAPAAIELQDEAEPLTPYEQERRVQAAHLEEIAKRLILPESALKEGTDAVIARLETRLRVLERSITNLESRQQVVPEETAKKIKPIADVVAQLQSRADSIEDRQRQSLAELRLSIHELTARQSALGVAMPDTTAAAPVWPQVPANSTPLTPDEAQIQAGDSTPTEKTEAPADNPRTAYLAAARNLAKEGARQAAELETLREEEHRARQRRVLTAAGVAGACLVAVGVLFIIRPGSHGVSAAQSKALAPVVTVKAMDSRAPLDRLTALANKGNPRAELLIGLKYLKGDGIAANDAQAAQWFGRAAQAGDAVAQNRLGALYQAGRGVPADLTQAVHWYQAAASQGDRHAMSNLAVLYASGTGVPQNLAEAARWFERSANLGYVDAQFNLAVLFERGDGVPQSLLDAYKWYSIAGLAGDPVAKARADAIATQISPEEMQAAQQSAANFKPQQIIHAANDEPSMADVLASAR
ncbi:MAG TPA: TetR family transcriptional regulator [Rhizomicrobium sp.]|nr:TetR family transcriptional regulator [Rhizomicrobium sp.]